MPFSCGDVQQRPRFNKLFLVCNTKHHLALQDKEGFIPGMGVGSRSFAVDSTGQEDLKVLPFPSRQQGLNVKTGNAHRRRTIGRPDAMRWSHEATPGERIQRWQATN